MAIDIWAYRETVDDVDLDDFKVEAVDGDVGRVFEIEDGSIIVETGPWIVGKKVMLPLGVIAEIDTEERVIRVDRTKEEIKNAPEWDPTGYVEQEYRIKLADYYSRFYT
jgi:hypothetical protein